MVGCTAVGFYGAFLFCNQVMMTGGGTSAVDMLPRAMCWETDRKGRVGSL